MTSHVRLNPAPHVVTLNRALFLLLLLLRVPVLIRAIVLASSRADGTANFVQGTLFM